MIDEFIAEIITLKEKEKILSEVMLNLSQFFTWEKKLGTADGYKEKLKENLNNYLHFMGKECQRLKELQNG